jgi:hypothetical protein
LLEQEETRIVDNTPRAEFINNLMLVIVLVAAILNKNR